MQAGKAEEAMRPDLEGRDARSLEGLCSRRQENPGQGDRARSRLCSDPGSRGFCSGVYTAQNRGRLPEAYLVTRLFIVSGMLGGLKIFFKPKLCRGIDGFTLFGKDKVVISTYLHPQVDFVSTEMQFSDPW